MTQPVTTVTRHQGRSAGVPPGTFFRPIALFVAAVCAVTTYADADLWGHVRFGLDIVDSGVVKSPVDQYSFTQDLPFLYHEWLGGVVMALVYRLAGEVGLRLLKVALLGTLLLLVWRSVRRAPFAWRWSGMALVAIGTISTLVTVRPQTWTVVGVAVVCRVLTVGSRTIWVLPFLFALWANLHGGWIVGGGVLALWTGVTWVQRGPDRYRLLAVGVLSLAATLVTPFGFELWQFLFETVRPARDDIREWYPIWRNGALAVVLWCLPVLAIAMSWRLGVRPRATTWAVLLFLALGALRVTRLGSLFTVATVILLAAEWPRDGRVSMRPTLGFLVFDLCTVATIVAAALWFGFLPRCVALLPYGPYGTADTIAGESLRGRTGRLVTSFSWGEYALWQFGPALKVSIDGRRETLYSERTVLDADLILTGRTEAAAVLTRINPDYVWLPATPLAQKTADWLLGHGFREDIRTTRSFVMRREELPPLAAWNGASSGCFPGP